MLDDKSEDLEVVHMMLSNEMDNEELVTPPTPSVPSETPIRDFVEMILDRVGRWVQWLVDNADKVAQALAMLIAVFI